MQLTIKKSVFAIIGTLAFSSAAFAQEVTPAVEGVVAAGTKIEFIKDGFKGTEGPVQLPDGGFVFTETQDNRITRISPDGSVSSWLSNSNGANGLGFTPNGDLYAVQVVDNRVGIIFPEARKKTLADN
jgi:gluconolactonase